MVSSKPGSPRLSLPYSPNSYVGLPTLGVMAPQAGTLGKQWGHDGGGRGGFINGVNARGSRDTLGPPAT